MNIDYKTGIVPPIDTIIDLYNSAGLNRPTDNYGRIEKMYSNSNLVITAWLNGELIGIARSLTDYCYCCYLSDLAVKKEFQNQKIGLSLIDQTKKEIGKETSLILLSAPSAMDYYPKVGFTKIANGFIIKRVS